MNNELTNIDKIYLRNALEIIIERNLSDIEWFSKKSNLKNIIEHLKDRNEIYQTLIIKLKNNGTI
jgi:hypothetical protein